MNTVGEIMDINQPCSWCQRTSEKIDSLEYQVEQLTNALELAKTTIETSALGNYALRTMEVINEALI